VATLLLVGCGSLPGCGYHLAGTGGRSVLPEHVEAIVVLPFENRTTRPEIEQRVTEAVAAQLSRRGGYNVVTRVEAADATLEGAITTYRTTPVAFTAEGLASRVEAVVTLRATVRDKASDEVLWSQSELVFRTQFDVEAGEQFFDEESLALDEIARGAAGALVTSIVEGF
jgi:TolB-like protein